MKPEWLFRTPHSDVFFRETIKPIKEFYDYAFSDRNVATESKLKEHDADKREIEADFEEVDDK